MKNKNSKITNKVKSGIASLLLGATLISGSACDKRPNNQVEKPGASSVNTNQTGANTEKSTSIQDVVTNSQASNMRQDLTAIINNTFSDYITVEGQDAGETIILEDGTSVTRRIGCVTAPNGDNVAWFGEEYCAIYVDGQTFLNENEYPEETEQYVSFKDSLLDIVNDEYHIITKLDTNTYQINDNDCNVYEFVIKDGKLVKIYDTYTEYSSGKSYTSNMFLSKTNEEEFKFHLKEARNELGIISSLEK